MNIRVINAIEIPGKKSLFFNVLFEIPDTKMAFIIPGWRCFDGKIYPPAKGKGKNFYATFLGSPELAREVQKALEKADIKELELEKDAWSSAKWGQAGLKSVAFNEEIAMKLWQDYREK